MKAMIFAAGLGTRLGEITGKRPKALVEIGGITVLERAVEKLTTEGFDDIIVNIHHFADMVEEEIILLRKKGYRVAISDERDLLLETGGGLQKAGWFFGDEPFLAYNSDIITDFNMSELLSHHDDSQAIVTLAVMNTEHSRSFLFDTEGNLSGWRNRSTGEEIISRKSPGGLSEAAFCGIQVVSPRIFAFMKPGIYSLTSFYLDLSARERIGAHCFTEGYWSDIGCMDDLRSAEEYFTGPA